MSCSTSLQSCQGLRSCNSMKKLLYISQKSITLLKNLEMCHITKFMKISYILNIGVGKTIRHKLSKFLYMFVKLVFRIYGNTI